MIKVYGNHSDFHNVSKVEVVEGYGDGVRKIVIHQVVETDRNDRGGEDGCLVVKQEITIYPLKETTVTPIQVAPIAMEVV